MHYVDGCQVDGIPWWEWDSDLNRDLDLSLGGLFNQSDGSSSLEDTSGLSHANDVFNLSHNRTVRDSQCPHYGSVTLDSGYSPYDTEITSTIDPLAMEHPNHETVDAINTGFRFPHAAVKVLRSWFVEHMERPYPKVGEVEVLQRQTGLRKKQILDWFANTRRRLKHQTRSLPAASSTSTGSAPRQRRPSPAPFHQLDPFQRWKNSPPESEPVSSSVIARAISNLRGDSMALGSASGSFDNSREDVVFDVAPSTSSVDMSQSGGSSCSSVYSYSSHGSCDSRGRFAKALERRRRRHQQEKRSPAAGKVSLRQVSQLFQCTFCTETFKTKYNWQRHENTFHLSLEKWQCAPNGPVFRTLDHEPTCVYCGLVNPDASHLETHNHATCEGRLPRDRTFYRKDHLRQHLKLVHNTDFRPQPMECWKSESKEVRSRCGFCGLVMMSWDIRAEHIAEHFKARQTMAGWQGDWGFEQHVLEMVENSMPPYLIHYESGSPLPFTTHQTDPDTATCAFELIQMELEYYTTTRETRCLHLSPPTDRELQYEACCIILGSEAHRHDSSDPAPSWLRDVLMSSEEIAQEARFRPLKVAAKTRLTQLRIHGKGSIFEGCSLEDRLMAYVEAPKLLNLPVGDKELQHEACEIVRWARLSWPSETGAFSALLVRLICGSAGWLAAFRQRAGLEPAEELEGGPTITTPHEDRETIPAIGTDHSSPTQQDGPGPFPKSSIAPATAGRLERPGTIAQSFSHDDNCYRRLTRELSRFVASTMSKHNPNSHIPTDAELQHQARYIMFDDDDPWNQTPADNRCWLEEFKKTAGLSGSTPE